MHAETVVLECRSRKQALDWSLVLISQGIESIPLRRAEDGVWVVELAGQDLPRARESIAAYERENPISWRRELKGTGMLFDARSILWFFALSVFHFLSSNSSIDFAAAGCARSSAITHGEWWRFFTAITLHADIGHLAANVTTGIVFLGLAMGCFRAGTALFLSFLGGAAANVITVALRNASISSLGASGMVMASLGLAAAHSLILERERKPTIWLGRGVMAGCLLLVLLGLDPKSDIFAHIGGFASGLLFGAVAVRFRRLFSSDAFNAAATLLSIGLVIVSWWLALRR